MNLPNAVLVCPVYILLNDDTIETLPTGTYVTVEDDIATWGNIHIELSAAFYDALK